MQLDGSCHCGAVRFSVSSATPYPYQRCYCSICRKTQGGGGYAINLGADANSMKVTGRDDISIYHAKLKRAGEHRTHASTAERHFCRRFASAVDTPLPAAPERTHLLLEFKAPWVEPDIRPDDQHFQGFPKESIAQWHERLGLLDEDGPDGH
jgi:hypothetical protein